MTRTRIIVYVALILAGAGLFLFNPGIDRRIAEVEALLSDADELLEQHQSSILATPGHPSEVETEIQIHRMSYLAVLKEKRTQRWAVIIGGPLVVALGLISLIVQLLQPLLGGKRKRKRKRRKKPPQRRKPPPRGKVAQRPTGRPRRR